MPKIEWTQEFSIGNAEIDAQHKTWIALYNDCHEKMMSPQNADYKILAREALTRMIEYGRSHFKFEESWMAEIGYADLETHKQLHRDFFNQTDRFQHEIHQGHMVLSSEVIKTIENWLVNHILQNDKKILR